MYSGCILSACENMRTLKGNFSTKVSIFSGKIPNLPPRGKTPHAVNRNVIWDCSNTEIDGISPSCKPTLNILPVKRATNRGKACRFKMAAKQLSGVLRTFIAAGKAAPSPPLGPSLGQVGRFPTFLPSCLHEV